MWLKLETIVAIMMSTGSLRGSDLINTAAGLIPPQNVAWDHSASVPFRAAKCEQTTATTEAVFSPPGENEHRKTKWRRNTTCAGQKPRADWKNDLQTYEKAENHENHPRRSWALNQMGNPS
jgi:hypothetical protein